MSYYQIYGQVVDYSEKTPLAGVKIEYSKFKTITDKNGDFKINNISKEDADKLISNKNYIILSKKGYDTSKIYPLTGNGELKFDLEIIELKSTTLQAENDQNNAQLYTDDEKNILNREINKKNNLAGSQAQLQKSISGLSSTVKKTLIPLLILLIAQFGISIKSNKLEESINNKQCPDPNKLLDIIKRRNKIVNQLNNLYKSIDRLSKILTALSSFLEIVKITFNIIKNTRRTITISTAFIPFTPGPVSSALSITKDVEDTLGPKIDKTINLIAGATFTTLMLASLLKQIIDLLKLLDQLVLECSQSQNISLTQLNPDIISISSLSSDSSISDSVYNGDYSYKGFMFEIKEDIQDNNKYVKRYAVAKNVFGVIVLKGESSYSSSTEILIEELKFIIDRDNLKSS